MGHNTLVFVVAGPEGYGIGRVWDLLFRALSSAGYEIVIAVLDQDWQDKWRTQYPDASVVVPPFAWRTTALKATRGMGKFRGIAKRGLSQLRLVPWLRTTQIDTQSCAIIFQGPIESMICGAVARSAGIPALWFVPNVIDENQLFQINRRIYRSLFCFCNVVPVSNSHFTDRTFGLGSFRRHVVHLGVDTDRFAPEVPDRVMRAKLGISDTAILIGVFARMTSSKGQMRLIQAIAKLKEEIHVMFCGGPVEGSYYDALVDEVEKLNLVDQIHFMGQQSDLRPYYAACDLIGNFRLDPEAFGLTVIEAMACGKPVLAHALGGPVEIIIDGSTGWLIHSCDVDSIVAGLGRAIRERDCWLDMGLAGRARVEAEFSETRFEILARDVVDTETKRFCKQTSSGLDHE